jgi:hypothetical protein
MQHSKGKEKATQTPLRLVLVPEEMMPDVERAAMSSVPGGASLDSVLRKRCRQPRRFGAPSRRNACDGRHYLAEVHRAVIRRVFPKQRGYSVKVPLAGHTCTAKRYCKVDITQATDALITEDVENHPDVDSDVEDTFVHYI